MFKKLIITIGLILALTVGGCTTTNIVRQQTIDTDIEMLSDGSIIYSGGVDEDNYKEFLRYTLSGKKHYTIRLHTSGGDAYSTIAVISRIKLLQSQGVKFTMIVPAKAYSAGSFIFMMGDERIMHSGAKLMWHTSYAQAKHSNKRVHPDAKKPWLHCDNWIVEEFRKQFPHITEEWIQSTFFNSGPTWQTAIEAKLMGICTKIVN